MRISFFRARLGYPCRVKIKKGKTTKATLKKLKSGKKYYVRVKAYKTVSKKASYGSYSAVKTVKVK